MSRLCELLVEDPDLGEHLSERRWELARRAAVARTIELPVGPWAAHADSITVRYGIGLLMLEGLLLRRVSVAGRVGAELLGPGDLGRPWSEMISVRRCRAPGAGGS